MSDEPIVTAKPSHWNFFWYYVFFWLLIPLIIAWVKRASLTLRVHSDRIVVERGLLSKRYKKFFSGDIRTISVHQSLLQRLFGIGDLLIATAGAEGYEIRVEGIPDPQAIQTLILQQKSESGGHGK